MTVRGADLADGEVGCRLAASLVAPVLVLMRLGIIVVTRAGIRTITIAVTTIVITSVLVLPVDSSSLGGIFQVVLHACLVTLELGVGKEGIVQVAAVHVETLPVHVLKRALRAVVRSKFARNVLAWRAREDGAVAHLHLFHVIISVFLISQGKGCGQGQEHETRKGNNSDSACHDLYVTALFLQIGLNSV